MLMRKDIFGGALETGSLCCLFLAKGLKFIFFSDSLLYGLSIPCACSADRGASGGILWGIRQKNLHEISVDITKWMRS